MKGQIQYLMVGYPFSGKTTLAKELEKKLGFTRLSIDEVKFELGFEGVDDADVPDEAWENIFKELDKRIAENLEQGKTIVNEYAWFTKQERGHAKKLADALGIETKVIFVDTSQEVVRERWLKNQQTKERFHITQERLEEAIQLFEKPMIEENIIVYSNKDNLNDWIEKNL